MAERLTKKYLDILSAFPYGINSGVAPLLLPKEQGAFAINTTFRGGYATDRAPVQKLVLNFGGDAALEAAVRHGFFQGSQTYRPDFGTSQIIAQISGRLFSFTEVGSSWTVIEITIPGDPNDATTNQVWMWQAEKWLIISDGTAKLPIFYDGVSCRRSYGPSVVLATTAASGNFPNPRVLGEVITVNLTAAYTGPYDVPVYFNGALYQPKVTAGSGYPVILTNIHATTGNTVPAGTAVMVQPDWIGYTTTAQSFPARAMPQSFTIPLTSVSGVSIGDSVLVPFTTFLGNAPANLTITAIDTTLKTITGETNYGLFVTLNQSLAADALIIFSSSQGPAVSIGNTESSFLIPAVSSSVSINITQAYTGPDDQVVWIGTEQYSIVAPPPPAPGLTLNLVNLTDTTDAGLPIPIGSPSGDITSVPEIPACRMGAYGLGQNWFSAVDGLSFGVSDLVGSSSGTQANNYRDAVLKTVDLNTMGYFRLPNSGEIITSMTFVATLDQALGQGPLQIGVPFGMFSVKAPFTLIDFQGTTLTDAISNPILTKSLIGFGPVAQNSTVLANSDTIFRSFEGVNSLILARRDFSDLGGNTPISREMTRVIQNDNQSLLSYSSAIVFDNRLRMTCAPNVSAQGVFHMGELVLNYDLLSSLRGKAQPVWDGLWTGLNILQYMQGMFGPVSRAFAFSFNITDTQIELYELLPTGTEHFDNGDTRIKWVLETPLVFGPTVKTLTEMCRLIDGEMYLSDVNGRVDVVVLYRPLFYPCWRPWHTFSICADMDAENAQEQVRYALGFGEPDPKDCDSINNQSFRDALAFQLRFEFTGHCKLWGVKCLAEEQPNPKFTKPAGCTPLCLDVEVEPDIPVIPPASTIGNEVVYFNHTCEEGWDLTYTGTLPGWITLDAENSRLVGLAGVYFAATQAEANALAQAAIDAFGNAALADLSLTCVDPEAFSNVEVYFVHDCGADTLTYDGTLPAWITLDDANSQLVGAAGTYFGATQEAANAAAQAALDAFGDAALGDNTLTCEAPNVCDAGFTDRFRITGYTDGSLAICPFQDTSADPVWTGTFETHQVISPTQCRFYNGGSVSVDGAPANAFSLALDNFTPGLWRMTLSTFSFGNHDVFWRGTIAGSSPIGVYTRTSGCDVTATLTVEQYTPP